MDDQPQRFPSPFILLLRVNLLQAVRRVTQAGSKSGLLTVMIGLFLLFYPLIASGMFYAGLRYVSKFPANALCHLLQQPHGRFADGLVRSADMF